MRKSAAENAEILSQSYFAEQVVCLEEKDSWSLIKTSDDYEGWVDSIALVPHEYQTTNVTVRTVVPLYYTKSILLGPLFTLPFGVGVKVIDTDSEWFTIELPRQEIGYIRKGNLAQLQVLHPQDLRSYCEQFIGIPYLWGGRSSFGYDCSGFSQMLYRQMGIPLPRDADPQSKDPRFHDIEQPELTIGDLIFWGHNHHEIRHVGIYLGDDEFIHATAQEHRPWLRVSKLNDPVWNRGGAYPFRCFRAKK